MEKRNLDFGIEVTGDQWEELGRTAAALGPKDGGYQWDDGDPERIHVLLRDEDAPEGWRDFVSPEDRYGAHERQAAEFRFNGGRPYARIEPPDHLVEPPAVRDDDEAAMTRELERWVRGRWHELMRRSGLHYDRGHIPQS